jgi:hypothetical protein
MAQVKGEGFGGGVYISEDARHDLNRLVTISNSTVAGNVAARAGGGISVRSAPVEIRSSILANNRRASGSKDDLFQTIGRLTRATFSLIEARGRKALRGRRQTNIFGRDPRLAPLADNGGRTRTLGLRRGSPAVDAGVSNGLRRDQRGARRRIDTRRRNARGSDGTDIGAFERRR